VLLEELLRMYLSRYGQYDKTYGTVAGVALAWGVDLLMGGVDARHPALAAPDANAAPASAVLRF